jgi:hypothetical protein
MPNLTPMPYRAQYEIYPAKGRTQVADDEGDGLIKQGLRAIGRRPGTGRGDSPRGSRSPRTRTTGGSSTPGLSGNPEP